MERSNKNTGEKQISEDGGAQSFFSKKVLITVITLLVLVVGITIAISGFSTEKNIMAPGPIGSTDSITQPLG